MRKVVWRMAAGVALGLLLPMTAAAQTSGIAGEVKDTSGAVLPGVTVEVASPALIEKVRSATTDGAGRYSITNLRTGIYSVTFTLPGFNTVKREGVELTSDFTASINGEMKVGAIEETITVAADLADRGRAEHHHAHGHDSRSDGCAADRPQHSGRRYHDSRHLAVGRRRRRALARRRRLRPAAAVTAPVPRLGRHGADHRRAAPQQPLRLRGSTAASTGTTTASRKSATSPALTPPKSARAACA